MHDRACLCVPASLCVDICFFFSSADSTFFVSRCARCAAWQVTNKASYFHDVATAILTDSNGTAAPMIAPARDSTGGNSTSGDSSRAGMERVRMAGGELLLPMGRRRPYLQLRLDSLPQASILRNAQYAAQVGCV